MMVWEELRSEQTEEQSWELDIGSLSMRVSLYKHMLISMCACVHSCEFLYELSSMRTGRAVRN